MATSRSNASGAGGATDGETPRRFGFVIGRLRGRSELGRLTGRALSRALEAHGRFASAIVEVHPRRLGRTIRGAPVIPPDALAARRGQPVVVSVAGAEARALIRAELARLGFRETQDYVCAA